MNWDNFSKEQKTNFIIKFLDTESSIQDLKDDVMQLVVFNDMIEDWWTTENENDIKEKDWKALEYNKKVDAIEKEIDTWDKIALVEFLVDIMDNKQIESFKIMYDGEE